MQKVENEIRSLDNPFCEMDLALGGWPGSKRVLSRERLALLHAPSWAASAEIRHKFTWVWQVVLPIVLTARLQVSDST